MKLIDTAIKKPVTVTVGVLLLVLFGFISLFRIPIQLTPNVDLQEISILTTWRGASPVEVEREVVEAQEEELKNVDGLVEMKSESRDSSAFISLIFEIGTDTDEALLRVSNSLERVKKYPDDVEKPIIKSGGRREQAIAWMVLQALPDYQGVLQQEYDFVDEHIKPRLERISGVSSSNIYGGWERQIQVVVDTDALSARKVTIPELVRALDIENKNISAGNFDEGKRRYIARTVGEYSSPEDVSNVIIKRVNGIPVAVGDIAGVEFGFKDAEFVVRHRGTPTIVFNAVREPGSNVLVVMKKLQAALLELNENLLKEKHLKIVLVYDYTRYIYSAINLVRENIFAGGSLAILVLLIFLRNFASTVIVAVAIPISVIGTFLIMTLMGRNINVVSLAGLSFAVGMVVDNSIVVFENIFRHREMGKDRRQAAYDGTVEVWGAVLASTLTTVAVFLPIVFVQEEAGQLFRDIAIAISGAVTLSLIISITVIPTLSSKILGKVQKNNNTLIKSEGIFAFIRRPFNYIARGLNAFAGGFINYTTRFVYWMCGLVAARVGVAVTMILVALGLAYFLMPKTEYMPEGNREILYGILLPPPGYNLNELEKIGETVEKDLLPLIEDEGQKSVLAEKLNLPPASNFFYVARGQSVFMGIVSKVQERTRELLPYVYSVLRKIPGMIAIVQQPSLFSRNIGEGRSIEIEIKGPDLEKLISLGRQIYGLSAQALPDAQIRPIPGLDLGNPEMRIIPNRERLTRLGMTTSDLGLIVDTIVDEAKASTYRLHGDEIDLVVKSKEGKLERTQDLPRFPVVAPSGEKVTLNSLAEIKLEEGPIQINHIDSQRSITLQVIPSRTMALEAAMEIVTEKVVGPIKAGGGLSSLYSIKLGGTADDLTRTRKALMWNFILALVISYLLMSALFENFFYPFIILFSVPLAAAGGFVGLLLVNTFKTYQPLDIITMLGFVILVGIVVNNAILIVHQTLNNMRDSNMLPRDAITESVRSRIRPIYMSAITTVTAMLPLVLAPGAGSEFYRGLGSVVVGGLLISTVFTIFLIPALLSLAFDAGQSLKKSFSR
ncbi:MAG: efflux RND transporter permease subunit [Desulfobacterales bacterium]|uniref:Efflux RND transporter permease subunit n=1 Tax=Candidatus Desulfatibia vada TaxID=2841696 RepID=A0A8J6TJ96_9BACT|nr:efflux RND transporter permease subunit [Candidatus Desulfatibia vada]